MARLVRAPTDHHHGRTCDHDHGGTAIDIIYLNPDDRVHVYVLHEPDVGAPEYHDLAVAGNQRRAALRRARAIIDAELGDVPPGQLPAGRRVPPDGDDAGQPDPAAVLAAVCRWITGLAPEDGPNWQLIRDAASHRPHD